MGSGFTLFIINQTILKQFKLIKPNKTNFKLKTQPKNNPTRFVSFSPGSHFFQPLVVSSNCKTKARRFSSNLEYVIHESRTLSSVLHPPFFSFLINHVFFLDQEREAYPRLC